MFANDRIERNQAAAVEREVRPAPVAITKAAPGRIDELQLHSEHVQEVLGAPPQWLVRWGITVIFLILSLLLGLSWVIRYPDVVPASIVITTPTPPSRVIAQADGALMDVRVRDNEHVARGALLATIQNSAAPTTVFRLQEQLAALSPDPNHPTLDLDFAEDLPLGELQEAYAVFVKSYRALRYYIEQDPGGQEIRSLEPLLGRHRERLEGYLRQRDILTREIELVERDYQRTRELTDRRVLPVKELDNKERQLLQARRDLEDTHVDIADTRLEINRVEHDLTQLRLRDRQQRHDLRLAFAEAYKNLRSRLAIWERTYVLRAPIAGQVSLYRFWSDHQVVKAGDEVLTIVPEGIQPPVGKMVMPVVNSGKVRPDQPVFIRLDNYPYQEYGLLKGVVRSISPVPREARYAIEVTLPRALTTTFGKQLDFRQEMQGRAEIVTEDLRLLERLFYQLRKLVIGDTGQRARSPDERPS